MLKTKKVKILPTEASPVMAGKLMKKSGNKYQLQMQERYVRLEGKFLRYYKKKADAVDNTLSKSDLEKQSVDLETSSWVRPYDLSPDCKTFEIQAEDGRVFTFEAKDPQQMKLWIDSIEMVRNMTKTQLEEAKVARIIAETPYRIRLFDSEVAESEGAMTGGPEEFVQFLSNEINEVYPQGGVSGHEQHSLKEHLQRAGEVTELLSELVEECQKRPPDRPADRFDVLAQGMVVVNRQLTARLRPVLQSNSVQLKSASLGDLHAAIVWLTQYQTQLRSIYCPVGPEHKNEGLQPTSFPLFDRLPFLCNLYVNGSSETSSPKASPRVTSRKYSQSETGGGSVVGATAHLVDHSLKVVNELFSHPSDMLQRHKDGSFFTNAPTELWSALHDHLHLASSTASPILHVLIADKISATLHEVIGLITSCVRNFDIRFKDNNEVKEIELEFVCALANDNALHIEEVMVVVNNFEMDEIRQRIDEIYNDATMQLIECGQTCLQRLADIVMKDVEEQLNQVFTPDWIEGNQVRVAIATVSDYLADFDTFLMSFWSAKFVVNLLETVIMRYIRSILFRTDNRRPFRMSKTIQVAAEEPAGVTDVAEDASRSPSEVTGGISSIFSFGKKLVFGDKSRSRTVSSSTSAAASTVSVPVMTTTTIEVFGRGGSGEDYDYCVADAETLGRIAQDVNSINQFFSSRVGSDRTMESLAILNEILLLLQLEEEEFCRHCLSRIAEMPSSSKAIFAVARACLTLREEYSCEEIDEMLARLSPAVEAAPAAAQQFVEDEIPEPPLGLLYIDAVPAVRLESTEESSAGSSASKSSLSSSLKMVAGLPLAALRAGAGSSSETSGGNSSNSTADASAIDQEELRQRLRTGSNTTSSSLLVNDVLAAVSNQEAERYLMLQQQRELEEERLAQELKFASGAINLEGHLEKKSPAHNLWQNRWFKLSSRPADRPIDGDDRGYVYTLMWFKKQGGSVIKSMEVNRLRSIALIESPRQLAYNVTKKLTMLSSEVSPGDDYRVVQTKEKESFGALDKVIAHFSFAVTSTDGKEQFLRASKVDKVIRWINALSMTARLSYDAESKEWN